MRIIDADKLKDWFFRPYSNEESYSNIEVARRIDQAPAVDLWHYPSRGELPDKDWSKHPLNVSKKCFVFTKRGIGTIARWDNDYRTWFEKNPFLPVIEVIAWQYFEPPKEEA